MRGVMGGITDGGGNKPHKKCRRRHKFVEIFPQTHFCLRKFDTVTSVYKKDWVILLLDTNTIFPSMAHEENATDQ